MVEDRKSPFNEYLYDQFPNDFITGVPTYLRIAYQAVAEVMDGYEFLKNFPSGKNARGHLIKPAVEYVISGRIEKENWPLSFNWETYSRNNGKYLRILTSGTVLTINQLQTFDEFPRDSLFRDRGRANNISPDQLSLLDTEPAFAHRPHLTLGHGRNHENILDFAFIGYAHHTDRRWVDRTGNMVPRLKKVETLVVPEMAPDVELSIKEDVKERLKDERI